MTGYKSKRAAAQAKVEGPMHVVCQCDKCKAQPADEPVVWMSIETAPKDGTDILAMYMHIDTQVVHAAFWFGADDVDDEDDIGWWSYEHSEVSRIKLSGWMEPTHWLPLPVLKEGSDALFNL